MTKPHTSTAIDALPTWRRDSRGNHVRIGQALLNAAGYPTTISGHADRATIDHLSKLQAGKQMVMVGICNQQTWQALTTDLRTVAYGCSGRSVRVLQCLLWAHRFFTPVDGRAGVDTIAKLRGFQVFRNVAGAVVSGRGDGVCGISTWLSLLTAEPSGPAVVVSPS